MRHLFLLIVLWNVVGCYASHEVTEKADAFCAGHGGWTWLSFYPGENNAGIKCADGSSIDASGFVLPDTP